MAGTAKHYVLNDGRKMYVDHASIPVALTHIKSYYSASAMRTTRDKGTAVIAGLQALGGTWRTRLLAVWKELKPLVGANMTLTEYRVRPSGSKRSCRFRQLAGSYRAFKPKNPVKGLKVKAVGATANTILGGTEPEAGRQRDWGEEPAPLQPPRTNPYRDFLRPVVPAAPRRRTNANEAEAAPDPRQQLQERIREAQANFQAALERRQQIDVGAL